MLSKSEYSRSINFLTAQFFAERGHHTLALGAPIIYKDGGGTHLSFISDYQYNFPKPDLPISLFVGPSLIVGIDYYGPGPTAIIQPNIGIEGKVDPHFHLGLTSQGLLGFDLFSIRKHGIIDLGNRERVLMTALRLQAGYIF